jgi:hypothetical protein
MSAHGGKRAGAGRKPGSQTKRTAEIVQKALEGGITPAEVLLREMRYMADLVEAHRAKKERLDPLAYAGMVKELRDTAVAAAPYCHARLSSTTLEGGDPNKPVIVQIVKFSKRYKGGDD